MYAYAHGALTIVSEAPQQVRFIARWAVLRTIGMYVFIAFIFVLNQRWIIGLMMN